MKAKIIGVFLLCTTISLSAQIPYIESVYPPPLTRMWYQGTYLTNRSWRTSIPNKVGPELLLISHHGIDLTELRLEYRVAIINTVTYLSDTISIIADSRPLSERDTTLKIVTVDDTTYVLSIMGFDSLLFSRVGWFPCDSAREYYNAYMRFWILYYQVTGLRDTLNAFFENRDTRGRFIFEAGDQFFWGSLFDNSGPVAEHPYPPAGTTITHPESLIVSVKVIDPVFVFQDAPLCSVSLDYGGYTWEGYTHPWAIDSTSIIMSVNADTINWGEPGLAFHRGDNISSWWSTIELNVERAGLTFSPGDTVRVCLLDVTDSINLVGPANHLGTDWHADYGPPIPFCWEFYISPTAVPEKEPKPSDISLEVYPNPANQTVKIVYEIPVSGKDGSQNALYPVSISIHDILGKKVKVLFTGALSAGAHTFFWDGTDTDRKELPSGLYYIFVRAGNNSSATKILMLK